MRLHTQVAEGEAQMPPGYSLYSGHIDWNELETLREPFAFSVLRNPKERIASFYYYLLKEAQKLSERDLQRPENAGKKAILRRSAGDYFFAGDDSWQVFIRDHYDNVYCNYFATRKMRGWQAVCNLAQSEKIARAVTNLEQVSRIYSTRNLHLLESDLQVLTGQKPNIVGTYVNVGDLPRNEARWPRLVSRFERDRDIAKLAVFARDDEAFLQTINLEV